MSELDRFFGIFVAVFFRDTDKHSLPHIHAKYSGCWASIAISDGEVLAGSLPPPALRTVRQWLDEYRGLVVESWDKAVKGERVNKLNTGFGRRPKHRSRRRT